MTKIKFKICGMRDASNIQQVAALRPDYMGFIFYKESPRYVGEDFAIPLLPAGINRVGVFVNAEIEEMIISSRKFGFDYLQLHGNESPDVCETLKKFGLKLIKVFGLHDDFDFSTTTKYESIVDYFLFDTKGKYYGGNAATFNWQILEKYNQSLPFFLSGGLSETNIGSIKDLTEMNLHALDMNSGIESTPGVKDVNRIDRVKKLLTTIL
jgi:phosphoribosylanthranilate isomerase